MQIAKYLKQLNIPIKTEWSVIEIPISNLSNRSFVWKYEHDFADVLPSHEMVSIDEAKDMFDLGTLPQKAREYFDTFKNTDKRPLLFAHIPHLLTADPVEFTNDMIKSYTIE